MGSVNPSQLHRQNQNQPESPPLPDDFIEQILVNLPPPWFEPRLPNSSSCDLNHQSPNSTASNTNTNYGDEDAAILASRLQHHQINGGDSPKPLLLGSGAYSGSVAQLDQIATQHFNQSLQNLGAATTGMNQAPAAGNGKKVRARRGQATDPHSIAERLRRDKIAQRMKDLQQLLPTVNKTDKASMLDEIIEYVKFLQLQVKVLSMSRLGGAAAVAPLLADISTEEMVESIQTSRNGAQSSNGIQEASTGDNLVVMENQVSKLMEEDIGSAMQYLRGKGLCLMPIALASILSAATSSQARNLNNNVFLSSNLDGPTSPDLSVLSTQSTMGNGVCETSVRDVTSTSNP